MENHQEIYKSLMSIESLKLYKTPEALENLGKLIDISLDLQRTEGLNHAIRLSEELSKVLCPQ